MKRLTSLFITLSTIFYTLNVQAYIGELLNVSLAQYTLLNEKSPSCKLIKNRYKEYKNSQRELIGNDSNNSFGEYISTYKYVKGKLFFEVNSLLSDLVRVQFIVKTTKDLQKEINEYGFKNIFFSMNTPGMKASTKIKNHINDFGIRVQYNKFSKNLFIQYEIPHIEYCFSLKNSNYISWLKEEVYNKQEFIIVAQNNEYKSILIEQQRMVNELREIEDLRKQKILSNFYRLERGEYNSLNLRGKALSKSDYFQYVDLQEEFILNIINVKKMINQNELSKRDKVNFYITSENKLILGNPVPDIYTGELLIPSFDRVLNSKRKSRLTNEILEKFKHKKI